MSRSGFIRGNTLRSKRSPQVRYRAVRNERVPTFPDYLSPELQAVVDDLGWPFVRDMLARGITQPGAIRFAALRANKNLGRKAEGEPARTPALATKP